MKKTKLALMQSIIALLLCASMLIGTTFAWFTESVSSGNNLIATGNLDVELEYRDADGKWQPVTGDSNLFEEDALWEPGHTEVIYLKISNLGQLALKYQFGVSVVAELGSTNALGEPFKLSDYIQFGVLPAAQEPSFATREDARKAVTDVKPINAGYSSEGKLYPAANLPENGAAEQYVTLVAYMPEEVGNAANYQTGANPPKITLGLAVVASQEGYESDSFGTDYDAEAILPEFDFPVPELNDSASSAVTKDENHQLSQSVSLQGSQTGATVPEGVKMNEDAESLTLTVKTLETSGSNLTLDQDESLLSLDVHMEGVSAENTVPMAITLREVAPKGMNSGNLKLYHVENGQTVAMTEVASDAAFTEHNQFKYDPATGDLELYMATFSEVTIVADTVNPWEGKFDYTWYEASKTELTIANADQLAGFGAIVGGMNSQTQDDFSGKTVKLLSDINLGDKESKNNEKIIFYPIGYYNNTGKYARTSDTVTSNVSSFSGTFDGAGHTISNFYQNTWEMFGDYNEGYSAGSNYYKDGMGLFGYVYGGTIKNLTVSNFSSDGEFTPTGVIAAYAAGNATFENIAITNCNPRVYNTGNGGIIGIAGNNNDQGTQITLKNITVDNSNKISALWGSWDVACGGLVGMFRGNADGGTGKIHFENCHVSAQIDVNNDVCANYQYYAYRYSGMIIGSVRHNTTNADGKTIPNMTGISAKGCTVNYGDWNDYYYCEFEKNTMASYSEDYQFSRIPHSELKFTDSNGNGVVDADERTSVTGCTHTHTDAEDKRAVYLPFHQLFTGYSWGVSSIGLEKYSGIATNLDITEGDKEESVVKFVAKQYDGSNITAGMEVAIGDLFAAIDGTNIQKGTVQVAVTDLSKTGITADYTPDVNDWTNGKLKFNSTDGIVKITIQDYLFCEPTSMTLTVGEFNATNRFKVKFEKTGTFLYRVGNQNPIQVSSLFEAIDDEIDDEIGNVTVTVTRANVKQQSENATYTAGTTWDNGTITFANNFTGPVTITISDDNFSVPISLDVEVISAYNVTTYSELKNRNSVLLQDIWISTNSTFSLENATIYGNGFEFNVTDAKDGDTVNGYLGGNYAIALKNATLDNIRIVGEVYTKYGAQAKSMYNYPTILTNGNSVIANSYVSNCSAPVRAQDGNLQIINSTLEGGIFANLDIRGGTVTLDNVITINQSNADGSSTSNDKGIVGLGIVFYECNLQAKLHVKTNADGSPRLKQYNFISKNVVFNETMANSLKNAMFGTGHQELQYKDSNDVIWINPCILSITTGVGANNIDELKGYTGKEATITGYTGYVYTVVPTASDIGVAPSQYESLKQYNIEPSAVPNHEDPKNYKAPSTDSNEHCYYNSDTNQLEISFDQGKSKVYDPNILTVTKVDKPLEYKVAIGGVDYTGKTITFDKAGTYTAVYTYTDPYNYELNSNGEIEQFSVDYKKTVTISVSVVAATAKDAKFTFYGYSGESKTAATTITDVKTVTSNSGNLYIMPSSTGTYVTSKTIDGITVNCPRVYVDFKDNSSDFNWLYPVFLGVKIEDYADGGTAETATTIVSPTSTSKPANLTILTTDKPSGGGGWSSGSGASGSEGKIGSGTYKGLYGWTSGAIGSNQPANSIYGQFTYKDNKGTTYYYVIEFYRVAHNCPTVCVTPDTLITLADGTQKEIQYVTDHDTFVVWDFYKGEFAYVPGAVLINHGEDVYKVITLNFDDGTELKVVGMHGLYSADLNDWVYIDDKNVEGFVGANFIKVEGSACKNVKLIDFSVVEQKTTAYSMFTALHYNCFFENMLTLTPSMFNGENYYVPFEMGAFMQYDEVKMQADIEKYGLYTYEDFADYVTYEQFVGFNAPYFKVSVGKGLVTYEQLIESIYAYVNKPE